MKAPKLSDLEQIVMNVVWDRKMCSVRCVMDRLQYQKKLAYTTVATILQRLHDKGLVMKEIKGMSLVYKPKISKSAYSRSILQSFIDTFVSTFGDSAIASFADSIDKLPKAEKARLLKLLEENAEV